MSVEILVAKSREEHTAFAAELMGRAISDAVRDRGIARVALSGGTTPSDTYRRVAALALPFDKVEWYWVDERGVPPDNARSNYGVASKDLSLADGKHGVAFRMEGERELSEAAASYDALLRRRFGVAAAVSFDVMTMGIGDDGHTASLFPGTGAAAVDDRLVAHVREQPEKKLEARVTLTAPVIQEAKLCLVIVRGAGKKGPVAAARAPGDVEEVPARVLLGAKGKVIWILDEAAAG